MPRVQASVVINRPVGEVWAYLNDIRNLPNWESGLLEVEQTSEGPVGVGTTFRGVNRFLGRRLEWRSVMTEHEPNRRLSMKVAGAWSFQQTQVFEPVEGGTRLTIINEGGSVGFFRWIDPIVKLLGLRQMKANLASLKDLLEEKAENLPQRGA